MRRRAGRVLIGLAAIGGLAACSESDATPGFMPDAPASAEATEFEISGPCNAEPDVAVEETDTQIVVSAVWRGADDDDGCASTALVALDAPIGGRDLVDRDAERRWAMIDGQWVSIGWCGVEERCEEDVDL